MPVTLLAYDIANPKRLTRVHRCLKRWGVPLQYSVWLVPGQPEDIQRLLQQLKALIVAGEDDIRLYALPKRPQVDCLGRARFQPGVLLLGSASVDQALAAFLAPGSVTTAVAT